MARLKGPPLKHTSPTKNLKADMRFRFIDLPPELRVMTYTLMFSADSDSLNICRIPSITRVSRSIRIEPLPLYLFKPASRVHIWLSIKGSADISRASGKESEEAPAKRVTAHPGWGSLSIEKGAVQSTKAAKVRAPVLSRRVRISLQWVGGLVVEWGPKNGLSFVSIDNVPWRRDQMPLPRPLPLFEDFDDFRKCVRKAVEDTVGRDGFAGFRVHDLRKIGWAGYKDAARLRRRQSGSRSPLEWTGCAPRKEGFIYSRDRK